MKISKMQEYAREIKAKSDVINKILQQVPKEHGGIDLSISKRVHEQLLRKKLEEIRVFMEKIG